MKQDCSKRSCPVGLNAWADLADAYGVAHQPAECSNGGICDRNTGQCRCFNPFYGSACQHYRCPNDCSGHGVCKSMRRMAQTSDAFPTNVNVNYDDIFNPYTRVSISDDNKSF